MNRLILNNQVLREKLGALNGTRDQALEKIHEKKIVNFDEAKDIILARLEREEARRMFVGLGGFPASGKTTGARLLVEGMNNVCHEALAVHLPMDGFHYSNKTLVAMGLEKIKGDISTYDVASYLEILERVKRGTSSSIFAPDYVREKHEVCENLIEIRPQVRVLVTEGIYVGYSEGPWGRVGRILDILFYLDVPPEKCADRIVARNLNVGRSEHLIEQKLSNDFDFMDRSIQILRHADYIIRQT